MNRILVAAVVVAVAVAEAALSIPLGRWLRRRQASLRVAGGLAATLLAAGALMWVVFAGWHLSLDEHSIVLWVWGCTAAVGVGLFSAAKLRRLPGLELAVAIVLVIECALAASFLDPGYSGISGPRLRALLIAPAALGLSAYFGASLGYLLWGGGRTDTKLGYEVLVGRRFLLSKASPVLSTVTTISVVGVALGVWLVSVSMGILAGFEQDLQSKIIGANAHVVLQKPSGRKFELPAGLLKRIANTPGVVASAPYVQGEVAVASSSNYSGALLFGIDPRETPKVLGVLHELESGSLRPLQEESTPLTASTAVGPGDFLPPAPTQSIVIGKELAKTLNVGIGDRIRIVSPLQNVMTPVGVAPRSTSLEVAAIFSSKMYEFDARFMYTSIATARRFFDLGKRAVSGVQVRVDSPGASERVAAAIAKAVGPAYEVRDWKQRNETLFSALELERVVAFVVLVFIILVASFSIVNTLTMSVIEKRKEIAILKTMGARAVGIMKLFLVQGMLVGVFGTLLGAGLAVVTVLLLERFGFWIPGEVYYIDSLPVSLQPWDVVLVVLAALLIVWDFAVFPALRGSQLKPVEGLRDG